ncbi:MAG TPA: twin-arginine translocase TatA/TatE family subunit [Ktedonobacterales bacterium]|jgi:sec-independent protein translocase protein TatA
MFGFHAWDLLIVLLIALVIFGPRKLPEIGGAVGKSIREFKKATNEIVDQVKSPEPKQITSTSNKAVSPEVKESLTAPAASVEKPQEVEVE